MKRHSRIAVVMPVKILVFALSLSDEVPGFKLSSKDDNDSFDQIV
jgi:hypothetical protein